jgi:hypothetical protein
MKDSLVFTTASATNLTTSAIYAFISPLLHIKITWDIHNI